MKVDEATLLPNLHRQFCEELSSNRVAFLRVSVQNRIPSCWWLLSQLCMPVLREDRGAMSSEALWDKDICDLMQALSTALAKDQQSSGSSATCEPHALHTHAVL